MKKLSITLCLLFLVCFALTTFGAGKPSSCGTDNTNLEVTVENSANNQVRSDGGSYRTVKGKGVNTDVRFQMGNCSYDLTMSLSSSRKMIVDWAFPYGSMASRAFNFDRVASVPVTDWNNESFRNFCGYTLDTPNLVQNPNGSYLYDNYAGCGKDPDTTDENGNTIEGKYFVRRAAVFTVEGYKMHYQNPLGDDNNVLGLGTSYVRVYRTDEKNYVLTPEVNPLSASSPAWASLTYGDNNTPAYVKDYQSMSFVMTVKNLQP